MSYGIGPKKHVTYKSTEVEELIDVYFHRPLARGLVAVLAKTPITSNQVTFASGFFGLVSGVFIALGDLDNLTMPAIGGLFLLVSIIFDCSDGQLARLRGTSSLAGRALDGWMDAVPVAGTFVGTALFLHNSGVHPAHLWPLGVVAGLSLRWHAEWYDHAKNLYIANTREGTAREMLLTHEDIAAERARLLANGQKTMAFFMKLLDVYTTQQRRGKTDVSGLDRRGMETAEERARYQELFVGYMRAWSWEGIGTHHFLMFCAMMVTPLVGPVALLVAWWIIAVPANLAAFALVAWGRRLERRLDLELGRVDGATAPTPADPAG